MSTQEEWRGVVGWESLYEVSNLGRARSIARPSIRNPNRLYGGRILRPQIRKDGYASIEMKSPERKTVRVYLHRSVLEAFEGPGEDGMECAHWNGVRADCRLTNLRWTTRSDNHQDKKRHGTWREGDAHPRSKLTASKVRLARNSQLPTKVLASRWKVSLNTILRARNRETWRHIL